MEESYSFDKAMEARALAYQQNKRFVLTNGCFDLLTQDSLQFEKGFEFGDVLWVGLNSDKSVRKLKGKQRPINSESDRGYLINSFEVVDGVFLFDNQILSNEILLLKPDAYVKSSDYNYESINKHERDALEKVEAKVFFVPLLKKLSSSSIIEKIKKS